MLMGTKQQTKESTMTAYAMSVNYSIYATLLHRLGVDTIDMFVLGPEEMR